MSDGSNLPSEGDYDATVQWTQIKPGPNFDYVEVTVQLEDERKSIVSGRINLTDAAAGINRTFFHAIGHNPDADVVALHEEPNKYVGNKTRVKIEHGTTKNGDVYPRIGRFLEPKLVIDASVRARLDRVNQALKAAKKENSNG